MIDQDLKQAAEATLALLTQQGATIATAESCTGGLIAAALTSIAGSSAAMDRGFITYTNAAKHDLIDVPQDLFERVGAVSKEVAMAMAAGALAHSDATLSVAVTGIAGPGGAMPGKPVGLVHIAVHHRTGDTIHAAPIFPGDRDAIRQQTVLTGLGMVRQILSPDRHKADKHVFQTPRP